MANFDFDAEKFLADYDRWIEQIRKEAAAAERKRIVEGGPMMRCPTCGCPWTGPATVISHGGILCWCGDRAEAIVVTRRPDGSEHARTGPLCHKHYWVTVDFWEKDASAERPRVLTVALEDLT
jgi:hypothetical protein